MVYCSSFSSLGSLLHARGAVTEKALSPIRRQVHCTTRSPKRAGVTRSYSLRSRTICAAACRTRWNGANVEVGRPASTGWSSRKAGNTVHHPSFRAFSPSQSHHAIFEITANNTDAHAHWVFISAVFCFQCFDTVGWATGRASGL